VNLRNEGKIRAIGISNVTLEHLEVARAMTDIASVQNRYNVADRDSEAVLRRCEELGIAFIPWAPVMPVMQGQPDIDCRQVLEIAGRKDVTASQLVLVWLLHHSPVMLPIPGTSKVNHLEENVAAATITLDEQEAQALAAA
jgi:aryl-alcohol dehydrogenase-like predicted oxidoreductase